MLLFILFLLVSLFSIIAISALIKKSKSEREKLAGTLLGYWLMSLGAFMFAVCIYSVSQGQIGFGAKGRIATLYYADFPVLFIALTPIFLGLPLLTLFGGYQLRHHYKQPKKEA